MSFKGIVKLLYNSALRKEFPMLNVDAPAPGFDMTDHRGRPVSLEALKGHFVVLWFFPKADTPG